MNPAQDRDEALAALNRALPHDHQGLVLSRIAGWVAVPHYPGGHFSYEDAQRLADAAGASGDEEIWAIAEEREHSDVYTIEATSEAIQQARNILAIEDVVFLPRSELWLYLASEAEFAVAAGTEPLVALLTGRPTSEANDAFESYLAEWISIPPVLRAIAEAPWETYSTGPTDTDFVVRW